MRSRLTRGSLTHQSNITRDASLSNQLAPTAAVHASATAGTTMHGRMTRSCDQPSNQGRMSAHRCILGSARRWLRALSALSPNLKCHRANTSQLVRRIIRYCAELEDTQIDTSTVQADTIQGPIESTSKCTATICVCEASDMLCNTTCWLWCRACAWHVDSTCCRRNLNSISRVILRVGVVG